jgi:hypothetical protein
MHEIRFVNGRAAPLTMFFWASHVLFYVKSHLDDELCCFIKCIKGLFPHTWATIGRSSSVYFNRWATISLPRENNPLDIGKFRKNTSGRARATIRRDGIRHILHGRQYGIGLEVWSNP